MTTRPDEERAPSVLAKVDRILTAFHDDDLALSLTELTARTGVAKATVHRLCRDLVAVGLLEREGTRYRLGLRLYEIGQRVPRHRALRAAARPTVEDLAGRLDIPITLAVPTAAGVLCVESAGRHRNRAGATVTGRRMPLHCTAAGKLTLAMLPELYPLPAVARKMRRRTPKTLTAAQLPRELERIRADGYATEVEEVRLGYLAAAVPVLAPDGAYLAALSAVAATAGANLPRMITGLTAASREITARLQA